MTDIYDVQAKVQAREGAVDDFTDAQELSPDEDGFSITYRPAADSPRQAQKRVRRLIRAKLDLSDSAGTISRLVVRKDGQVILSNEQAEYVTDVEGVPLQYDQGRAVIGTGELQWMISPEGLRTMARQIEQKEEEQ